MRHLLAIATALAVALLASCALIESDQAVLTKPTTPQALIALPGDKPLSGPLVSAWSRTDFGDFAEELNADLAVILPDPFTAADRLLSAPWIRSYDFSGIAWDDTRAGTVVHPQFVALAAHYTRPVGSSITFTTRAGESVTRRIIGVERTAGLDRALAMLDSPLPSSIPVYRVLPSGYDWDDYLVGSIVVATDQERKGLLYELDTVANDHLRAIRGTLPPEQAYEQLVSGDSGHPTFLIWGGELILLSTHWTALSNRFSGPFISAGDGWYQDAAERLMAAHSPTS